MTEELLPSLSQGETGGVHPLDHQPHSYAALRPDRQAAILGTFSEKEQQEIRYRQQILSSLAYFIGKDFQIPVELNEPGEGWHWDFQENKIRIDPQDLVEKPMDYLRFVISHEGGHRRISRPEEIPMDIWVQPGFSFMMNAIEDPRTNNFVAESYPKFREQMKLAYEMDMDFEAKAKDNAKEKLGYQPKFMQAGFEYIKQWFRTTQGQEFEIGADLPDDVREVVQATLQSAQDSWLRYPSRPEADQSEDIIKQYSDVSYEINRDEIWPEFKKLVEKDLEDQRVQEMLQEMARKMGGEDSQGTPQNLKDKLTEAEQQELGEAIQKAMEQASKGQEGQGEEQSTDGQPGNGKPGKMVTIDLDSLSPELKQKIQDYIDSLPDDVRKQLEEKARATLQEFEKEINEELGGKLSDTPEKQAQREAEQKKTGEQSPKAEMEQDSSFVQQKREASVEDTEDVQRFKDLIEKSLRKDENVYEQNRREVLPVIDALERDLREIFVQRLSQKWESGYRTGKRIDIKRRMQEKAKGVSAVESKAWQKREVPQEKDYAIALLVDLSGSMRGEKIQETFKGAVVLAEVLNRLSINTEILGFNDKLYEYQAFGEEMGREVREHMGGMLQEVSTPSAAYNDDGWAVQVASERLSHQKAKEKFLFVLSDGQPAESSKHPKSRYELGPVVRKITEETDQKLIGLGIGPGTNHVEEYYPNSIANITVADMPERLSDVIREAIVNYDTF